MRVISSRRFINRLISAVFSLMVVFAFGLLAYLPQSPISHVKTADAAAPTFVAASTIQPNTNSSTNFPAGMQANDIIIWYIESDSAAISVLDAGGGTWTEVSGSPLTTTGTRLTVYWSRYNGSQTTPTTTSAGDHQIGRMIAVRGVVETGDPWDVISTDIESTSDTSVSIPGATTTVANTLVVAITGGNLPDANGTTQFSNWANADLSNVTERTDNNRNDGNGGSLGLATGVKVAAGTYGSTTADRASSATKTLMTIALKPSVATVTSSGTQTATLAANSTNQDMGAKFVVTTTGATNITALTITESGTVNGSTNLDNIKVYQENDTSAPYDCASESLSSPSSPTENQYGSTDTDGFSGANGTSAFSESVAITTTGTMCLYVVLDVTSGASNGETIELSVNAASDVTSDVAEVGGSFPVAVSGTTTIATGITISGNAYDDESTGDLAICDGSTANVKLKVGSQSATSTTCADSGGAYNFSGITTPSAGDTITVFFDTNGGSVGTTVARYDGSGDVTNLHVRKNRFIVSSEDSSAITNTILDNYDNGDDSDVVFTVTSSNLTVEDGIKLIVYTGDTFTPGGTITTDPSADGTDSVVDGDVDIQSSATLSMGTNALSVGGDFNNSGTFSYSSGQTTTFTATATGHTIEDGTSNFDTVTFNGSSGGWSFSSVVTITGALTMTAGDLSGTNNITANHDVVGTAGTITLTGGTFEQRIATSRNFETSSGSAVWSFNNLTFSNSHASAGVTVTTQTGGSGGITVSGSLLIGKSGDATGATTTLDAGNRTWALSGSSPMTILSSPAGVLTANTSTINFTSSSSLTVPAATYYNIGVGTTSDATALANYTAGGDITIGGVLTIGNAGSTNLDIFDASDKTITFTGSGTPINLAANTKGQYNGGTSTTVYTGTSATNIVYGDFSTVLCSYYNLTLAPASGSPTYTLADQASMSFLVIGDFVVGDGTHAVTVRADTWDPNTVFRGNVTFNSGITYTKRSGAFTFQATEGGSSLAFTDNTSTKQDVGALNLIALSTDDVTVTMNTDISVTSVSIAASQTLITGAHTLTILGSGGSLLSNSGTFTTTGGTVAYKGSSTSTIIAATYNNLQVLPSADSVTHNFGAGTFTINGDLTIGNGTNTSVAVSAAANSSILNIAGGLTINANTTFTAHSSNSFTVGSNWSNSGTFTANSGTVTFTATSTGKILSGTLNGSSAFYNLAFNGSGGGWSNSSAMLVSNALSVSDGALSGTNDVTINGCSVGGGGDIAMTGGTFLVDCADGVGGEFGSNTSWDFYNLAFGDGSGTSTIGASGAGGDITITNTLTIAANQTLDASSKTWILSNANSAKPFVVSGGFTPSTSTINYTGDNDAAEVTVEDVTYYNLGLGGVVAESYFPEGSIVATNDLTVSANATLGGTSNVTVNGSATGAGTITLTGGTFEQRIAVDKNFGTTSGSTNWSFNNLTFSNSDSSSHTVTTQTGGSGTLTVSGQLLLSKTGDADATVLDAGNRTWVLSNPNAANPFEMDEAGGLLVASNSTFQYTGDYDLGSVTVEDAAYYNAQFGGAVAEVYVVEGDLYLSGSLTINANGTVSAPATISIAAHFTNNGVFTANGGTVTFAGAVGVTNIIGGSSDTTFFDFGSEIPGTTLQFASGRTYTMGGTFTVRGSDAALIAITSSSPGSQWYVTIADGSSVRYVSVLDSGCVGGNNIPAHQSMRNLGNNGSCWLFVFVGGGNNNGATEGGSGGGTPPGGGTGIGGGSGGSGGDGDSGGGTPPGGGGGVGGGGGGASP